MNTKDTAKGLTSQARQKTIKVADLANSYFEISKICRESKEPVFIVQNGKKDVAIISIELYEEILGKKHLYYLKSLPQKE